MGSSTDENKHDVVMEGLGALMIIGAIGCVILYVVISIAISAVLLGPATLAGAAIVYAVSGIVYRDAVSFRRALGPTLGCLGISAGSAFAFLTILVEIRPPFECRNGLHDLPMLPHCMHRIWARETDLAMFFLLWWLALSIAGGTVVMKKWMIPVVRGFADVRWAMFLGSVSIAVSLVTLCSLLTLVSGAVDHGAIYSTPLIIVATVAFCAAGAFVLGQLAQKLTGRRGADTECFARIYGVMFVGCLTAAALAIIVEHWHAGLVPMARAIAATGIRNLRPDAPTVRDALPWFLLVLAPGVLALIMSVVLGLGRPFRGLGTITVLAVAMTLVAFGDVGVVGVVETLTLKDARGAGSPDVFPRGPDTSPRRLDLLEKAPSPSTRREHPIHPQVKKAPRHR